ncbi:hypothetical protein FACS189432_00420 [Bacteroidia bacterium]|nr:hypothetical protein FACS189426_23400 [Bacteroidia bacterium]GHT26300.1 hypothetical protein FACS189432_00420 [Bacteroidia bacterium]
MQKQDSNRDKFSEMIKDKLENYSLPADDSSWNAIEKRLNKKPIRRNLWPWFSGISAAAAIAILVIIQFPNREKNNNYGTTNLLSGYEETISEGLFPKNIPQPVIPPINRTKKINGATKKIQNQTETKLVAELKVTGGEQMAEQTEPNPISKENQNPVVKENQNPFLTIDLSDEEVVPVKKRKNQKSIGLSLGSGGNLLAMNKKGLSFENQPLVDAPQFAFSSSSDIALKAYGLSAEDILSTKDFSKINHYPPLSFGLTVRKELNPIFSLETGIVYTFLHSEFSNSLPKREAKLQLHYLGIPLNLNANIYGNRYSKWVVYLSTGGMVEKGLLSHYTQKQYLNNELVVKTTTNENIDGLQWSVALAPGIDYKLSKNYSLYLEPKLSYYFDNSQPISVRTEHPLVFGVNAGFRFSW